MERDHTEVHLVNGEKEHVSATLKEIETELKKLHFLKISRSVIVNLNHVASVDKKTNNCVLICDGKEFAFIMSKSIFKYFENLKSLKL